MLVRTLASRDPGRGRFLTRAIPKGALMSEIGRGAQVARNRGRFSQWGGSFGVPRCWRPCSASSRRTGWMSKERFLENLAV